MNLKHPRWRDAPRFTFARFFCVGEIGRYCVLKSELWHPYVVSCVEQRPAQVRLLTPFAKCRASREETNDHLRRCRKLRWDRLHAGCALSLVGDVQPCTLRYMYFIYRARQGAAGTRRVVFRLPFVPSIASHSTQQSEFALDHAKIRS